MINMEFNELESFLMVEKYRSFSKAAEEMYLSQPTISNNIRNLEKTLNTRLFDRKGRNITLTHSGEIFFKYATELVNLREEAIFNIRDFKEEIHGTIEINTSSAPEEFVIPYIMKDFLDLYPDIKFSVHYKNSKDIVNDVIEGKKPFGIVGAKFDHPCLKYDRFFKDELILAVSCENKLSSNDVTSLESLKKYNFIFREKGSGTRQFIENKLVEKDIFPDELNIVSLVDSPELIKKMIELNLGVSFLSRSSIENEIKLGLIKAISIEDINLNRYFYFVSNKNRTLSPTINAFKDFLIEWSN